MRVDERGRIRRNDDDVLGDATMREVAHGAVIARSRAVPRCEEDDQYVVTSHRNPGVKLEEQAISYCEDMENKREPAPPMDDHRESIMIVGDKLNDVLSMPLDRDRSQ